MAREWIGDLVAQLHRQKIDRREFAQRAAAMGLSTTMINQALRATPASAQEPTPEGEGTDVSEGGSDSENPVIPSPTPKTTRPRSNQDWWPNQLDLSVLHQHSSLGNPMGEDFN